jgi:hypothetical protein
VYVPLEDAAAWRTLLPGWSEQAAVVHVHPTRNRCRGRTARALPHARGHGAPGALEEQLASELVGRAVERSRGRAFESDLPVAFAYAAHQTETWFDLSIDTLGEFRRRGHGTAAAAFLIHHFVRRASARCGARWTRTRPRSHGEEVRLPRRRPDDGVPRALIREARAQ